MPKVRDMEKVRRSKKSKNEDMDQDRTTGLPDEAYEQPEPYGDPKPKGFSRGGGAAVTGTKFEGVF